MEKKDIKLWEEFRAKDGQAIDKKERELIATLHAKYFNHKYEDLCTCNPRRAITWIKELNELYDGHK